MSVSVPVIDYIDGGARRIYLLQGVDAFHWIEDVYREYVDRRSNNEDLRKWSPLMRAAGNDPKGLGKFTPRYVTMLDGCRVIPYDENISIYITGEAITDNADVDPDPFDTSTRVNPLKLFITPPAAEIVRDVESLAAIEHMSFDNMITIDPIDGVEGVTFPAGNKQYPVKYNQDAYDISVTRRIKHLHFVGVNSITAPLELDGYTLSGDGPVLASLHIDTLAEVQGCFMQGLKLSGVLDGGTAIRDSLIDGIHYFNGSIRDCGVSAKPVVLGGISTAIFNDCKSMVPGADNRPTVDFDNQATSLAVRGWSGGMELINKTTTEGEVSIDMDSGILYIRASCTAGKITVRGLGRLVDESPVSCEVDYTGLLDPAYIQYMTYDGAIWLDESTNNDGTTYPVGTEEYPVNNWADAVTLSNLLKFHTINFTGISILPTGTDVSGKVINGVNATHSSLVTENNSNTRSTTFMNLSFLDGYLDGNNLFRDCYIDGMHGFTGMAHQCTFTEKDVYISGQLADQVNILDCFGSSPTDQLVNFNFVDDAIGTPLTMRNWSGCAEVTNHSTAATCCINFTGEFFIRASCDVGQYDMSGNGKLWDESTGASTVISYKLSNPDQITKSVWGTADAQKMIEDILGRAVISTDDLHVTIYNRSDNSVSHEFDISADKRIRTPV